MFGYVTINPETLAQDDCQRFRAYYCGLCRTLGQRYDSLGRMTLSYDMTFLWLLLSSLYEPSETRGSERCAAHPAQSHDYLFNSLCEYAADMNIALSYHLARDGWRDDHSLRALTSVRLLKRNYHKVEGMYPEKCAHLKACIEELSALERAATSDIDAPVNCVGRLIGDIFVYTADAWSGALREIGAALGKFIYIMDAYDDLEADRKKRRFNPLASLAERPDYEATCRTILNLYMAECARAFEALPLERDLAILRNILYSGVWTKYALLQGKRGGGKEPVEA